MAFISRTETQKILLSLSHEYKNISALKIIFDNDVIINLNILNIENKLIYLDNVLFTVERVFLKKHETTELLIISDNGALLSKEDIYFKSNFFAPLIELSRHEIFPPFYMTPYEKPGQIAVLTLASNDTIFLKIFIDYYSKITDPKNIFIIDHGSDLDSEFYDRGIQRIKIPKGYESELNKVRFIESFQRFLLTKYKWVIKTDLDELLLYRYGPAELAKYLINKNDKIIIQPAKGFNLVHNYKYESELDISRPVSFQRRLMVEDNNYAKPSVAAVPVNWILGFHQCLNYFDVVRSEDFMMIHLASVSVNERLRRNKLFYDIKRTPDELSLVGHGKLDEFDTIEKVKWGIDHLIQKGTIELYDWMIGQF